MKKSISYRPMLYAASAGLLLIPLIAMQFTKEVQWTFGDFAVAAFLFFGTAAVVDFIITKTASTRTRIMLITGALLVLCLVFAELAVGIFGSPFAGS